MPARKRIVFKRAGSSYWHFRWQIDGRDVHGSTKTLSRSLAEQIALKAREDALTEAKLGIRNRSRLTLDQAFGRYWEEHAKRLAYARTTVYTVETLKNGLGPHCLLDSITDDDLTKYVATRRSQVSNATVNRELDQFGAMNRRARDMWSVHPSPARASKHSLPEPNPRTRYLDRAKEA